MVIFLGGLLAVFLLSPLWVAVLLAIYVVKKFVEVKPWERTAFEEFDEDEVFIELED